MKKKTFNIILVLIGISLILYNGFIINWWFYIGCVLMTIGVINEVYFEEKNR